MRRAADAAQLGETIRTALPNGLDTTIGERSEHDLSDGQTQRLSIARYAMPSLPFMFVCEFGFSQR